MASSDPARPDDPGPHARLVALQDALYDLVLTSVARPCAAAQLPRLRRDAQHAAALAEQVADAAIPLSATGDAPLDPESVPQLGHARQVGVLYGGHAGCQLGLALGQLGDLSLGGLALGG